MDRRAYWNVSRLHRQQIIQGQNKTTDETCKHWANSNVYHSGAKSIQIKLTTAVKYI